jgi:hypothetical protein
MVDARAEGSPLVQLIEKWRSWEYLAKHAADSSTQAFVQCADELEALVLLGVSKKEEDDPTRQSTPANASNDRISASTPGLPEGQ